MKLMTKEIEKKARTQYPLGSDMTQNVVAKFFDPTGSWTWYLMNQDPEDPDYLWGIVKGFEVEMGASPCQSSPATKGASAWASNGTGLSVPCQPARYGRRSRPGNTCRKCAGA